MKISHLLIATFLTAFFPIISFADHFACSGTEPFWTLSIGKDKFTFKKLDEETINFKWVEPKSAVNTKPEILRIYQTTPMNTDKNTTIIVQKQTCSDGMSDHKYTYQTIFLFDNQIYHGCCEQKVN